MQRQSDKRWRQKVVKELKAKIGNYCQGCSTPDNWHLQMAPEFLELVFKNRRDPKFNKFGNNTITIHVGLLKGRFPLTDVELLCHACRYAKFIAKLDAKREKGA